MDAIERQIIEDNQHYFAFLSPRIEPVNRQLRHMMADEYDRLHRLLFDRVEYPFYEGVFDPDKTYNDNYNLYFYQFTLLIKYIDKVLKPKFWIVNKNFFVDNFRKCNESLNQ